MPRLLGNIPWIRRIFSGGARPDIRPEARDERTYESVTNMRGNSVVGNAASLESIGGEQPRWRGPAQYQPIQDGYVCIGACSVKGNEVSFWAHVNGDVAPEVFPPLVVINGFVMAASPLIPYRHDRPLQFGDVASCDGGVIYPADHFSDPLYWNIPEIIEAYNSGTQQYLSGFSLDYVSVAQFVPPEWPEFTGLVTGDGLPPGQYQYWLRYVTQQGDRTNNGPPTPLISVPRVSAPIYGPVAPPGTTQTTGFANQYPGGQTIGGPANPDEQIPTSYGIALRFIVENRQGYRFVEVIRRRFNDGQGLQGPGIVEVIARLDIEDGLNDISFIDPTDANFLEVIPNDTAEREQIALTAPKAVEHTDNRVVYANFRLKDLRARALIFREALGRRVVAITQKVSTWYGQWYNDGFADPVNNTYLQSAQHGERYSIGLQLWDGTSTRSPVVPIADNVTMPWRRDRKTGDSLTYSSDPIYAANNECQGPDPVSPTFDAFVQGQMSKETSNAGGVGFVNVIQGLGDYNPWTPVGPSDDDATRYRYSPINVVYPDGPSGTPIGITGHVWSPEVHSLGMLVYGPENLQQAAPWAKVMSVVTSPPADRVVAEGIFSYALFNGTIQSPLGAKLPNSGVCQFPDIISGAVPQSVLEDIQANPSNYFAQLTPYGFYTEVYGYARETYPVSPPFVTEQRSNGLDMLSFAGVQYDSGPGAFDVLYSVNAGEASGTMGVQPTFSAPPVPTNYVGPGLWRRLNSDPLSGSPASPTNYSPFYDPANADQGAFLFGIEQLTPSSEGRSDRFSLVLSQNVYTIDGINSGQHFSSQDTRRFNEPMYVVKIIRKDAEVPELNVQQYRATGSYIVCAPEGRAIGYAAASTPSDETTYELFHARKDDCVGRFPTDYRYCYIQEPGQPEKRYVCVTGNSFVSASLPAIAADIAANGYWQSPDDGLEVHGVYRYVNQFIDPATIPQEAHPKDYIRFGGYPDLPVPAEGSRIAVKYDKRAPWRVFGFDRTISPCIFGQYDRPYVVGNPQSDPIWTSACLPYSAYQRSPGYIMPRTGSSAEPVFLIENIRSIRQWCVMWMGMTRTPSWMQIGAQGDPEHFPFPRQHYVIRPYQQPFSGFYSDYGTDYPNEENLFTLGGIRFWTRDNLDYAKQPLITYLSDARNGANARLDYCQSYVASERRDPLSTDTPGNRSFFFENIYPVSEENGEIKSIHILDQGGQQNLWGLCEQGVHYVPYNKAMLTDADGDLVATQSVGSFWPRPGGERWIARGERGCPDQFWRFSLKAHSARGGGDADTLYWADRSGFYRLIGGQVQDIGRNKYMKQLLPLLREAPSDYSGSYSAVYNYRNSEAWFGLGGRLHVFNPVIDEWQGVFSYSYDQYQSFQGSMIGYRTLRATDLDTGLVMLDGVPVACEVTTAFFPSVGAYKEAMRFRVVGSKPDYIEVYDQNLSFLCRMDEATGGVRWVKLYDGWEGWISRVSALVSPQRPLPQSMGFWIKAGWFTLGPKQITALDAQIKNLP